MGHGDRWFHHDRDVFVRFYRNWHSRFRHAWEHASFRDAVNRLDERAPRRLRGPAGTLGKLLSWTCPGFVDGYGLGFQALCCGNCLLS